MRTVEGNKLHTTQLYIVGGGNMGCSIASGVIEQGSFSKDSLFIIEPDPARREFLQGHVNANVLSKIATKLPEESIVLLAIKPQVFEQAAIELADLLPASSQVISIMAGVSIERIKASLPVVTSIARVMPNLPAQIGMGVSGYVILEGSAETFKQSIDSIMDAIGVSIELENEDQIDALTAVSGSGPAYFLYLVESLIEAAVENGFSKEVATTLVECTMYGTAGLLQQGEASAAELRKRVTSPGGTTEAAINFLQESKTKQIIQGAVQAAYKRSKAL